MKVLSLFSGVGGFDMGLEAAGMTTAFQCEIDKHATSVLEHHWPDVPRWDDVSTLTGAYVLEKTGGVDVVAWGSPCQDLSLAGKRKGLAGERSGLFHEGVRIIREIRELTNGTYPKWSVWENVYGALSSNGGADFGQVLWEMDEAGACFSEWAVLDAQYFGVPQRRRRIFLASCFDSAIAGRCPDPLFPVSESLPGDFAKGAATGEGVAGASSVGVEGTGWPAGLNKDGILGQSVTSKWHKGSSGPAGDEHHNLVVEEPLLVDGRRVDDVRVYTEPVQTLQERMGTGGNNVPVVAQEAIAIQNTVIGRNDNAGPAGPGHGTEGGPMFTLDTIGPHAVAITQQPLVVRRLTPIECERLMGWPDNHTAEGSNGPISDTQRYKMCGNGVASPVAAWLGRHILNAR